MTEPLAHIELDADATTKVGAQLRTRVVREARRETWFIVNEGANELAEIPFELRTDAVLRRVDINGEATEFTADGPRVLVTPRSALRPGAGTIIVLHFR